ncbi:hypothetical protein DIPPA_03081 [Diplonema papillatum]|nr:hypothetical protein DIPPA_03081 [Diplonema papillatum]
MRKILTNLNNLKALRISKNREVTDNAFCDLGIGNAEGKTILPLGLSTIAISSCIQLTNDTITEVAKLPNLTSLSVSNCRSMSAKGLAHLTRSCGTLRKLEAFSVPMTRTSAVKNITALPLVNDDVLHNIWTHAQSIELVVVSSQQLTEALHPDEPVLSLRHLALDFCFSSPEPYSRVAASFPNLSVLSMQGSVAVPTPVLSELLSALPTLRTLRLCVDSEGVVPLQHYLPGVLNVLDLEYGGAIEKFPHNSWRDLHSACDKHRIRFFGDSTSKTGL